MIPKIKTSCLGKSAITKQADNPIIICKIVTKLGVILVL